VAKKTEKKTKRKGGGKLNRTHMVTIRLDPKLRYFTDLAARTQRRTTSGFIEWAIEKSLSEIILNDLDGALTNLVDETEILWDIDEPDRFVKLALNFPYLLTYDEQVMWKLIGENGYLWKGTFEKDVDRIWTWNISQRNLIIDKLREHWDTFKDVADGKIDASELPQWEKDDPIPF